MQFKVGEKALNEKLAVVSKGSGTDSKIKELARKIKEAFKA